MIRCAKCGALFRSHYNQKKIWQCVTYREKGREACASKSIPDEILRRVCCALMGTESFDEDAFRKRVAFIEADNDPEGSFLVFHMTDGTEKLMRWNYPSRRESWTPEMKAKAAEQARKRAAERYGVR